MIKIFRFSVLLFIFLSFNAIAQHDKDWNSKTYPLGEFKELYLEGGYHVFLIQGEENSLMVKASDDDVFKYIDVKNNEQSLSLKITRNNFNLDRISLYLTFKDIEKIHIEGGVTLKTEGYLDLQNLDMLVQGGAKIDLQLKAKDVRIVGEGGLFFKLDGVSENLDVRVSGAAHVDASEFKTKTVSFKVEGVGTGSVYATETLNARIFGVGKIKYKGNPEVSRHIEGVGTISSE